MLWSQTKAWVDRSMHRLIVSWYALVIALIWYVDTLVHLDGASSIKLRGVTTHFHLLSCLNSLNLLLKVGVNTAHPRISHNLGSSLEIGIPSVALHPNLLTILPVLSNHLNGDVGVIHFFHLLVRWPVSLLKSRLVCSHLIFLMTVLNCSHFLLDRSPDSLRCLIQSWHVWCHLYGLVLVAEGPLILIDGEVLQLMVFPRALLKLVLELLCLLIVMGGMMDLWDELSGKFDLCGVLLLHQWLSFGSYALPHDGFISLFASVCSRLWHALLCD